MILQKNYGEPETEDILRLLNNSAEDFRKPAPDFNGSLTNARAALQTLATSISRSHNATRPAGFDETKWGQIIAHLRTSGVISEKEEKGLAGVFTFVSMCDYLQQEGLLSADVHSETPAA